MFVCDECEWALCRYFRIGKPHLLLINHVLVLIYAIGVNQTKFRRNALESRFFQSSLV